MDGVVVGFDKHTVVRVARDHIACTGGCATQCVVNGPRLEVNAIALIPQAGRSACIGANEVALDRVVRRGSLELNTIERISRDGVGGQASCTTNLIVGRTDEGDTTAAIGQSCS